MSNNINVKAYRKMRLYITEKEKIMKEKKKIVYPERLPFEDDDEIGSVASANECTGLTSSIPIYENEASSYRDIYNIPVEPKKRKNEKNN